METGEKKIIVQCKKCKSKYRVRIPDKSTKYLCKICKNPIIVKPFKSSKLGTSKNKTKLNDSESSIIPERQRYSYIREKRKKRKIIQTLIIATILILLSFISKIDFNENRNEILDEEVQKFNEQSKKFEEQLEKAKRENKSDLFSMDGEGRYLNYNYWYKKEENQCVAVFNPFLPRNDAVVIGAMYEVIDRIYGKHELKSLTPTIVNRSGTNLIQFEGINYNYLFLIVKEDTGEVNSFSIWRESKY